MLIIGCKTFQFKSFFIVVWQLYLEASSDMVNVIVKVKARMGRKPLKHVPRCPPSTHRPVLLLLCCLKDIDVVSSLLKHLSKITSSNPCAGYSKVHLDGYRCLFYTYKIVQECCSCC